MLERGVDDGRRSSLLDPKLPLCGGVRERWLGWLTNTLKAKQQQQQQQQEERLGQGKKDPQQEQQQQEQ
jgi:hypothetical protein